MMIDAASVQWVHLLEARMRDCEDDTCAARDWLTQHSATAPADHVAEQRQRMATATAWSNVLYIACAAYNNEVPIPQVGQVTRDLVTLNDSYVPNTATSDALEWVDRLLVTANALVRAG